MGLRNAVEARMVGHAAPADVWGVGLRAASLLFEAGVRLRGWCLGKGLLSVRRLPAPVISVGNITVGGTGKTPTVMLLAGLLRDRGHTVAVLSRGYARRRGAPVQLVSDGRRILAGVEEAGDEPIMMAHRLPGVWIWVGVDRFQAGEAAWTAARPTAFLLDDGFQHRRLHRDLDVVTVKAERPLGNGRLIPAGPLREPPDALGRAGLILATGQGDPGAGQRDLARLGSRWGGIPMLAARYGPCGVWRLTDGEELPARCLGGRRVALVSGIADPAAFESMVSGMGAKVEASLFFRDHYWYTSEDIEEFRAVGRRLDWLVTTEKDAWKLRQAGVDDDRWVVLRVELRVEPPEALWARLEPVFRRRAPLEGPGASPGPERP
jgi:tetraacyldisaccharide 4'-kinase